MTFMGIDIGTTGCKAVVFNEEGKQLSHAYREYNIIRRKPEWAELDSNQVINFCLEVIKEAAIHVKSDPVLGIGISSQGEAYTPVDKDGQMLENGMVSSDMRAAEYIDRWNDLIGSEKLYKKTGHTPHPLFTLYKLLWLKEHHQEIWKKSKKFLCYEDLLHLKLGLDSALGWPLAGRTMLFNILKHQWDDEILEKLGIRKDQLSRPLQSGTIVGYLPSGLCSELHLSNRAFVVTGGHDQPCGALGSGVTKSNTAMYSLGTVDCICPRFDSPIMSRELYENNLCTYDFTAPDGYTTVSYSLTGGNLLKWYRDEFGFKEKQEADHLHMNVYDIMLAGLNQKPTDLLVLPYFTPSGTPYFDIHTKGAILGLRLSHTRNDVLKALLEGVTLEMKLNLEILKSSGIQINELRITGGGARSRNMIQLKADVLNTPITVIDEPESGCKGVAMLAYAAKVNQKVEKIADLWVKKIGVVEPDGENKDIYEDKFLTYKEMYNKIQEINL